MRYFTIERVVLIVAVVVIFWFMSSRRSLSFLCCGLEFEFVVGKRRESGEWKDFDHAYVRFSDYIE